MKQLHLLLLLALSTTVNADDFTHRLKVKPEVIDSRDSDVSINIQSISSSTDGYEVNGVYLVTGRIKTKNPKVTTLYFGVTAQDNKGSQAIKGFAQAFYPEEHSSEFSLALKVAGPGQMHLSAYERRPDGNTDWAKPIIRLNIQDIVDSK
jgi:hypothetical protein